MPVIVDTGSSFASWVHWVPTGRYKDLVSRAIYNLGFVSEVMTGDGGELVYSLRKVMPEEIPVSQEQKE